MAQLIKTGKLAFPSSKQSFNTREASQYCGYNSIHGINYHIYVTKFLKPDEFVMRGKAHRLLFYKSTLDKFLERYTRYNRIDKTTTPDPVKEIQIGRHLFPEDKERFTTVEAAQYCGYATKTGFTHHIYNTHLIVPDETIKMGKKASLLLFYRKTLDKFIERRRNEIRPGPQ